MKQKPILLAQLLYPKKDQKHRRYIIVSVSNYKKKKGMFSKLRDLFRSG